MIRPSRDQDVLRETFGGEINCAGVADGWRAYSIFPVLQRCWGHLIREVDAFREKPDGKELSEIIHLIQGIKGVSRKRPTYFHARAETEERSVG